MYKTNNFWLHSRLMVTESYDYHEVGKTMMYYSTPFVKESDFPFNFYLLDLPQNNSGLWVKQLVDLWMANMPTGKWANWVVSVHRHSLGHSHIVIVPYFLIPVHLHLLPPSKNNFKKITLLSPKLSLSLLPSTLIRLGTTTSLGLPLLQVRPMFLLSTCCC